MLVLVVLLAGTQTLYVCGWKGPGCLLQERVDVQTSDSSAVVCVSVVSGLSVEEEGECGLDKLIATLRDLYTLKKRLCLSYGFRGVCRSKIQKDKLSKTGLKRYIFRSRACQDCEVCAGAMLRGPQSIRCAGARLMVLTLFCDVLMKKRCDPESTRRINELKTLRNLRPCVGQDSLFRIDGRLENAELPIDAKASYNFTWQACLDALDCPRRAMRMQDMQALPIRL